MCLTHRLCVRFTAKDMLEQPVSAAGFEGLKYFFFLKKRLGYYTGSSTETTAESIKFLLLKLFMEEVKKPQLTIYHPFLLWDF